MLVARELLILITSMVSELRRWGQTAVPEATVQAQYIAIVCMLRSVGHVLQKTDCADAAERKFLNTQWNIWKKEPIFTGFIEPARNDLLKEYKSRLQLRQDDVSSVIYANPDELSGATTAVNFVPDELKDMHGRMVMPLFKEAIVFWDKRLAQVEAFRASTP